jgi:Rps23 Pro-64 3,4-dihydroxylase Tpa1-like proline 4-hydroxylase
VPFCKDRTASVRNTDRAQRGRIRMLEHDNRDNTESSQPRNVLSFEPAAAAAAFARQYSLSEPYPHIVIDEFFNPEVANSLARHIISLRDRDYRVSFKSLAQSKLQLGRIKAVAPDLYPVYAALMEPAFAHFVEVISGYSALAADRQFTGAGLHRYHRDGFSEVHLDSNRHPFDPGLIHRVNLLVFLNAGWQTDWGGELVLWSDALGKPAKPSAVIEPAFNRGVLFSVTDKSWHSVNPVRCPAGQNRNSIAIYYFSREQLEQDGAARSVIWHSKRKSRQLVFEATNRLMTRARPYAQYLRWLRPTKFDGASD